MIGREDKNGPQGDGINEDVSFTLNTVDRHAVYTMTTGSFAQVSEDKAPTVLARNYKDPTAVCYGIGRDTFNQGQNAKFAPTFEKELQPTLVAKGPGAIQSGYTVRRLTPTECARLQGFPDNWCADLGTEKPSDEEMYFWHKVFKTYSEAVSYTHLPLGTFMGTPHGNGGGPISTKENRRSCSCVPNLSYISKEEEIKSNKHAIPAFAHVKDFSSFENTGGHYA